jgi:hypothetical protein
MAQDRKAGVPGVPNGSAATTPLTSPELDRLLGITDRQAEERRNLRNQAIAIVVLSTVCAVLYFGRDPLVAWVRPYTAPLRAAREAKEQQEAEARAEVVLAQFDQARSDVKAIAGQAQRYRTVYGSVPATVQVLMRPVVDGAPPFVAADRAVDPWGQSYQLRAEEGRVVVWTVHNGRTVSSAD